MLKTLKKYFKKLKNTIMSIDKFLFVADKYKRNGDHGYSQSDVGGPPKIF